MSGKSVVFNTSDSSEDVPVMRQLQYRRSFRDPTDGCTLNQTESVDFDRVIPLRLTSISSLSVNQQDEALPHSLEIQQLQVNLK